MADSFGALIRTRREACTMSLRCLARQADISPTYLSHIERGQAPAPALDIIRRIAVSVNLPFEVLVRAAGKESDLAAELVRANPALLDRLTEDVNA